MFQKKPAQLSSFVVNYPLEILTYREHHFKTHITEFLFTVFSVSAECRLDGRMQTYKFMKKCGNFFLRYTRAFKRFVDLIFCRNTSQARRTWFFYAYAEFPNVHSCKFSSTRTQPFVCRQPMNKHGLVLHGEIDKVSGINFLYMFK